MASSSWSRTRGLVRQIDLQNVPSGSWGPLPGDLVWFKDGSVKGQWPPDGVGDLNEMKKLDGKHPALVITVERFQSGEERVVVFHNNRFWWIPRNHWMR